MTLPAAVEDRVGQPSTVRVGTVVSLSPLQVEVQGTLVENLGIVSDVSLGQSVVLLGQSVRGGAASASSWLLLGGAIPAESTPWVNYVLSWAASGTQPLLNDGAVNYAQYRFDARTREVTVRWRLTFGPSTNGGTGAWFFGVPLLADVLEAGGPVMGAAWFHRPGVDEAGGLLKLEADGASVRIAAAPSTGDPFTNWGQGNPVTLSNGQYVAAMFSYHAR